MGFEDFPLPNELRDFISRFKVVFPEAREVWLFGSRVDGTASPESDWDLMAVCGRDVCPEVVARAEEFRSDVFSVFIVN